MATGQYAAYWNAFLLQLGWGIKRENRERKLVEITQWKTY